MAMANEVLASFIGDFILENMIALEKIDLTEAAHTRAVTILEEIRAVIQDCEKDDFKAMEEIVCIFEKYRIETGARHDF